MFVETDVDEAHDWDILNINEGLWPHLFSLLRHRMVLQILWPFFKSCSVEAGLDLLEGDIQHDKVRLAASEQ